MKKAPVRNDDTLIGENDKKDCLRLKNQPTMKTLSEEDFDSKRIKIKSFFFAPKRFESPQKEELQ